VIRKETGFETSCFREVDSHIFSLFLPFGSVKEITDCCLIFNFISCDNFASGNRFCAVLLRGYASSLCSDSEPCCASGIAH
jgi:hypothetical protein